MLWKHIICLSFCVSFCMCVCERESKREKKRISWRFCSPAFPEIGFWSFALSMIIVHLVHTCWQPNFSKPQLRGCRVCSVHVLACMRRLSFCGCLCACVPTLARIPGDCRWQPNMPAKHTHTQKHTCVHTPQEPGPCILEFLAARLQLSWTARCSKMANRLFNLHRTLLNWNASFSASL